MRLHCIRYGYIYSYFCQLSTESKRVPLGIFPCKPPVSQQPLGQTGQTLDLRPFTTHKEAYFPKIKPKMTLVSNVARVQLKHNSSVTQPCRACNTQHVVSRAMESVPLTHSGNKYTMVCYGNVNLSKLNTSTSLCGAPN